MNDSRSSVEIVRTLLECRADRGIFSQKVANSSRSLQGLAGDVLRRFGVAIGRKVEDDAEFAFQGSTVKARRVRYTFQRGGVVAQVRRPLRDEVPGGVASES